METVKIISRKILSLEGAPPPRKCTRSKGFSHSCLIQNFFRLLIHNLSIAFFQILSSGLIKNSTMLMKNILNLINTGTINLPVRIKRQRSQIQQKFNIFVNIRSSLTSFSLLRTYPFALNGNAPKYNKNSTFLLIFVRLSLRSCLCERVKKTTQIEWVVFCILMVSLVFII